MTIQVTASSVRADQEHFLSRIRHWAIIRIVVQVLMVVVTAAVSSRLLDLLVPAVPSPFHTPLTMIRNLLTAGLALMAYKAAVRWMERRKAAELDLYKGKFQLFFGAMLGVALMTGIYLVLWLLHLAAFTSGSGTEGLGVGLIAMFVAAVFEELLFRAILFRIIEGACGTAIALAVTATIFGLMHGLNPGATLFSDAAIAIEAGLALALAYALTRNLWLPIGIHMGWNFAEGSLFGAQVSGHAAAPGLIHVLLNGPAMLTGGGFGPEASIISVGVCSLEAIVLTFLVIRSGHWQPRVFRLSHP